MNMLGVALTSASRPIAVVTVTGLETCHRGRELFVQPGFCAECEKDVPRSRQLGHKLLH